ncbi:unnamed protein product [Miscanthus lutarioriparius]|uniref:Uncharacterized protein n=1 Tax=Miscanthus lutarioriparius TaxID=422564 RepID=A0A811P2N5_9POAL|nr:unnamed protein product [Miscanthus lutarioriparius]
MSSPPLSSHAKLPTTGASACHPRPRDRHLLVRGWSVAAATPLVATSSSSGPACCHHYSVATAPSLRASSFASPRRAGGAGLDALTVAASAVAVSACLIFFSAIRSMLACKRDAEFLEKYFDSAREKLPETMASVRLVGREIGDLAADLSDLSQELTKGVKSSMSIIHTAEAQLRQSPPSALPGELQFGANNLRDNPSNYNLGFY